MHGAQKVPIGKVQKAFWVFRIEFVKLVFIYDKFSKSSKNITYWYRL